VKDALKETIGLSGFLCILLIVILVLCTLFSNLMNIKAKNDSKLVEVRTYSQLNFIFEDGSKITQNDFKNNYTEKKFTIVNESNSDLGYASMYQLNLYINKYEGFKLGDIIYSINGTSTNSSEEDVLINGGTFAFPSFSSSIGMGTIKPNTTHEYKMIIKYVGNENINNKEFEINLDLVGNITYILTNDM
jgi:hypothetical protein